jgi:hypothetical protein
MEAIKMRKEITMSIHEFMEINRGNLSVTDLKVPSELNLKTRLLLISLVCFMPMSLPLPVKAMALDTNNTVSAIEVLYITTAVLLEVAYEVITSTASIL